MQARDPRLPPIATRVAADGGVTAALDAGPGPVSTAVDPARDARRAWSRLGVAVAISAALHTLLFTQVEVAAPVSPDAATPLRARLSAAVPDLRDSAAESTFPPGPAAVARRARGGPAAAAPASPETREAPVAAVADAAPAAAVRASTAVGVDLPLVVDPEYYPARQLDEYPRPVDGDVGLLYPERAVAAEMSGTLKLLVLIDELGMVDRVEVVEADPEGWFEDAAIESFRRTLFVPARRLGRAVRSRLLVEVRYEARTGSARVQ